MSRIHELRALVSQLQTQTAAYEIDAVNEAFASFWGKSRWEKEAAKTETPSASPLEQAVAKAAKTAAPPQKKAQKMTPTRSSNRPKRPARPKNRPGPASTKEKRDLVSLLSRRPKVRDPEALAAWIGRRIGGLE